MHANELVLLAAQIADRVHGGSSDLFWKAFDLESYWSACRHRMQRWDLILKDLKSESISGESIDALLQSHQHLLEEVLLSDVHCRIWTAAYHQSIGQGSTQAAVSVVRSIWIGQQESRCKVLRILAGALTHESSTALELNRLRRKTERWNDVMLAQLGPDPRLELFAVDRERVRDFQESRQDTETHHPSSWPLFHASISHAFPKGTEVAASPQLNQVIYDAIKPVLGSDSTGKAESLSTVEDVLERLDETSRKMDDWLTSYLQ